MAGKKEITVSEIAALVGGEVVGDGKVAIRGVSSLEAGGPDRLGFLGNPRFEDAAKRSDAGALIVRRPLESRAAQIVVQADPYAAFIKVMNFFHPDEKPAPGVHPSAVVGADVTLGDGVSVGPLAVIGDGAEIGARAAIGAGAVIGAGSEIGEDSVIHANVTIYGGCRIGKRVVLHSGVVIGADGFGFVIGGAGSHVKKPQVGDVLIEDDVEIGANCTVDRAMLDSTVIGEGSKFDNLVHIAHGVRVGKHCMILAGTVVGGSTVIGDRAIISGHVTVKDNIKIGERVMVVGHSGVMDDVAPGEIVWGMPAIPHTIAKRVHSRLKQLPELFKRVRELEKKQE